MVQFKIYISICIVLGTLSGIWGTILDLYRFYVINDAPLDAAFIPFTNMFSVLDFVLLGVVGWPIFNYLQKKNFIK